MSGRHTGVVVRHGNARRWLAGVAGLALAGGIASTMLASTDAAAAPSPKPNYNPGTDTATFTTLGVRDANCLVSTGGAEVWIKPGDKIDFDSDLAGITVASLNLGTGSIVGLNVTGTIDAGTNHARTITVTGGKKDTVPASALSAGDHKLTWKATSIDALGLLGVHLTLPLSNANLQSGASLEWTGVIHVVDTAPQCKLAVSTPSTGISVGPIKVTVPPVNVSIPGVPPASVLPSLGNLLPTGAKTTKPGTGSGKTTTKPRSNYTPPGLTVPEQVVPQGGGNGGSDLGSYNPNTLPGGVANGGGFPVLTDPGVTGNGSNNKAASNAKQVSSGKNKTIDLAADTGSPSGQLPVILAIIAIIALAMVAGTYARLFLLKREQQP